MRYARFKINPEKSAHSRFDYIQLPQGVILELFKGKKDTYIQVREWPGEEINLRYHNQPKPLIPKEISFLDACELFREFADQEDIS